MLDQRHNIYRNKNEIEIFRAYVCSTDSASRMCEPVRMIEKHVRKGFCSFRQFFSINLNLIWHWKLSCKPRNTETKTETTATSWKKRDKKRTRIFLTLLLLRPRFIITFWWIASTNDDDCQSSPRVYYSIAFFGAQRVFVAVVVFQELIVVRSMPPYVHTPFSVPLIRSVYICTIEVALGRVRWQYIKLNDECARRRTHAQTRTERGPTVGRMKLKKKATKAH